MGSIQRKTIGQLTEGQPFLEGNGRTWIRVGWDSVDRNPGTPPPRILEWMGLVPVCDMGGNVNFASVALVVTAIEGEPVDDTTILEYWQYAVN